MEEGGGGQPADAAAENRDPRSLDPCPGQFAPTRLPHSSTELLTDWPHPGDVAMLPGKVGPEVAGGHSMNITPRLVRPVRRCSRTEARHAEDQ
jgi:hypothetical protein